jgi:hypothetical protein
MHASHGDVTLSVNGAHVTACPVSRRLLTVIKRRINVIAASLSNDGGAVRAAPRISTL